MSRSLIAIVLLLAWVAPASAEELLPRPAALEPAVRFWTRVYTEVDGNGGLVHDSSAMHVVYEELSFPSGMSERLRERRVEKVKRRLRAILDRLARGKRTRLSDEEQHVLSLWPKGVANSTLRSASRRLRFQLGQADKFRAGLVRSGAWRGYIVRTLREHGVPTELVALPHVESSFNPKAYSRVGAAGLWQFTRQTGRRFLRIDTVVDERLDIYKATVSAARLLRENHRLTKAWPLAITAYNHGASGMRRATKRLGTRDIAAIVQKYKSRTFGFASRNFYASFLAASAIDQDVERYFGRLSVDQPVHQVVLELPYYYPVQSIASVLGVDVQTLRTHNPALRPSVWNGSKYLPRGYSLRLPRGMVVEEPELLLARVPEKDRITSQHRDRYHKVRRGDTLSRIASRYKVSERELMSHNNLRSRHRIRAGQVLVLPDRAGGSRTRVARSEPPANGIYRVRSGDTISRIARRYGVPEVDLIEFNGLRNPHRIAVGTPLKIPGAVPAPETPLVVAAHDAAPPPADAENPPPSPVITNLPILGIPPRAYSTPDETPTPKPENAPSEAHAPAPAPAPAPTPTPATAPSTGTDVAPETVAEPEPAPDLEPEPIELASTDPEVLDAPVPDPELLPEPLDEPSDAATPDAFLDPTSAPPVEAFEPPAADPQTGRAVPDPSDYAVHSGSRITVQANETLGHYAEWLETRASQLRSLNRMRYGQEIVIGRAIRLDFGHVSAGEFEQRRLEYHRSIQEEFFDAWAVTGTEQHVLRSGDTLWYLARRKYRVPVWLLRQYNPELDFGTLPPGATMVVPRVAARESS